MNHSRRKRMKNKLGYSECRVAAIMCQERRNYAKKRKKRAAKTP